MHTKPKKPATTDAIQILDSMVGEDPTVKKLVADARLNARVAQRLYDLRTEAGLSQGELARKVGTTQSVISRLEDADYEGHSLTMLQRIAAALDQQLDIRFVPATRKLQVAVQFGDPCGVQPGRQSPPDRGAPRPWTPRLTRTAAGPASR